MAGNVKGTVKDLVADTVESMGYELVDVDFTKQPGDEYILTVYIDSAEGITIDDCEKVSRAIDPIIDEADPIAQQYYLCVSSLGLDRPLKTGEDFERSIGKCIDIKLYRNLEGRKLYSGRLVRYDEERIYIEDADDREIGFDLKDAAKITMHIDF